MAEVTLNTARIHDWATFHDVRAEAFGFPDFYGRKMNAWIDGLTDLFPGDGLSRFTLGPTEQLVIHMPEFDVFMGRLPEVAEAMLQCVAFVHRRSTAEGERPRLSLVLP